MFVWFGWVIWLRSIQSLEGGAGGGGLLWGAVNYYALGDVIELKELEYVYNIRLRIEGVRVQILRGALVT